MNFFQMNQGVYDDASGAPQSSAGLWSMVERPLLTAIACGATAALLAGTGFMEAATALDGGLGATIGIILADKIAPLSPVTHWIVPIAVPSLIGGRIDSVSVGTGLVATITYTRTPGRILQ